MASSNLPLEIASTLQSASINRSPSPSHDLNPSTTSSQKQPVSLQPPSTSSLENEPYDEIDDEEEEDIPYSVLKPIPRRQSFPPLPDLRFEQSYLASIAGAETWGRVVYITVRDQVCLPSFQSDSNSTPTPNSKSQLQIPSSNLTTTGNTPPPPRDPLDPHPPRLAALQPRHNPLRFLRWRKAAKMVV